MKCGLCESGTVCEVHDRPLPPDSVRSVMDSRERMLEDALNHLLNAVRAEASPDLMATAVREAEVTLMERVNVGNHVSRVRAFLRRRAMMKGVDPQIIYALDGHDYMLTTKDLDALCRDAERLVDLEDL